METDPQHGPPSVQHVDVCVILPACFGAAGCVPSVMSQPQKQDCHTLLARPFLVSPAIKIEIENSLEMALCEKRSIPARNTKLQQAFNATDICVILPAFCGFMVSGELLEQLGAFRASCRNPKNRIATRSNAWIWRGRFWSRLLLK